MKFDPHKSEEKYKEWRNEKGAPFADVSRENAELLLQYLDDMEIGANVSPVSKKGARSYIRLRNLKSKVHSWAIIIEREIGLQYLPELENHQREFLQLIKKLRDGQIMTRGRKPVPIRGAGTMIKALKAFWHWYQRIQRKQGVTIQDITQDLDSQDPKPHFNYFTLEQLNAMCNKAGYYYRVLMMFLFDSGIRAPTELMNVKLSDLEWNDEKKHYVLTIRQETSKTFGRRIKLLLCSEMLKGFIKTNKIKEDQFIFTKRPQETNQYLKKLAYNTIKLGELKYKKKNRKGQYYYAFKDGLTLYDFRHSSACYWLPRYKSESALKYRFGWTKSSMIHYYTELLGMRDTIEEEDLYVDVSKTQLEREIANKGNEISLLQEQLKSQDDQMKKQKIQMDRMMQILESIQQESENKSLKAELGMPIPCITKSETV